VTAEARGIYPTQGCINAPRSSDIKVMVIDGKPRGDQEHGSKRITAMVAERESRENQGDHSWKDATVGTR
jgi:hypothetical protein